ncbi:MAG: SRPBCC domain-containing protein [Opitutaceae bacterium]
MAATLSRDNAVRNRERTRRDANFRVGETMVAIDFNAVGADQTEVVLTHERFSTADSSEHHEQGWTAILERMTGAVRAKK